MNYDDALKSCKESKSTANFASIPDETTNAFVTSKVSWRSWIGLEKVNGEWVCTLKFLEIFECNQFLAAKTQLNKS